MIIILWLTLYVVFELCRDAAGVCCGVIGVNYLNLNKWAMLAAGNVASVDCEKVRVELSQLLTTRYFVLEYPVLDWLVGHF